MPLAGHKPEDRRRQVRDAVAPPLRAGPGPGPHGRALGRGEGAGLECPGPGHLQVQSSDVAVPGWPPSLFVLGKYFSRSAPGPNPQLNGTRRATMPQVLTRRREPITLLAKRGHLHLQPQKLALVVITLEAEAHSLCSISLSHSLGTVARLATALIASSLISLALGTVA
jgi:hypothetical protein